MEPERKGEVKDSRSDSLSAAEAKRSVKKRRRSGSIELPHRSVAPAPPRRASGAIIHWMFTSPGSPSSCRSLRERAPLSFVVRVSLG
jgi:hypothetical protein